MLDRLDVIIESNPGRSDFRSPVVVRAPSGQRADVPPGVLAPSQVSELLAALRISEREFVRML